MIFLDRIRQEILERRLLKSGDRLIVGVSGGADSLALLHALMDLRHEFGWEIVVAHYDHALRSSSSRDRRCVEKISEDLGLPFLTETNNVKKPSKGSLEDFARERRYAFFHRAARGARADVLVLAHTRDDVAETVLMRILRGAGLSGLRAIRPVRWDGDLRVVRPMLGISRAEVENFLRKKKVGFLTDPSNKDRSLTRNRIRLDLIPHLEKHYAPDIKARLASLAATVAEDYAFMEAETLRVVDRMVSFSARKAECPLQGFCRLPIALRRMVLRAMIFMVAKNAFTTFSADHIAEMDNAVSHGRKGMRLILPGGIGFCKGERSFVVKRAKDSAKA